MDKETKLGLFKSLLLARVFEEKKIELATELAQTDISPGSCYGQEAIPVGFCYGLNKDDFTLVSIRSAFPIYLTKGLPIQRIAEEMYAKAGGYSYGRELSTHITDMELGIIGGTGILAQTITVAAGLALAATYKKTKQVAICFMGDGASNREEFYSGINLAAIKKLPAIFVVESNQIAEHTPIQKVLPIENIADRAAAFGIPGKIVDGNDVMAVHETAQEAITWAREGRGPYLIECKTCRVRPMNETEGPERGLPAAVIEEWLKKDPVKRMKEHLVQTGVMSGAEIITLKQGYQEQVDEAFDRARNSDCASSEEVFTDVYAEGGMIE
jgi:TPP-dependent pyruvate/acetoin dehydrogenase alpha subunit